MVVGSLAAFVDIAAILGAAAFEGLQGAFFADDEVAADDLVSVDLAQAASVNMAADDAVNLSSATEDSNVAAAGTDVAEADDDAAEAGNSAATIDHATYEPGRTLNLLTEELADFTEPAWRENDLLLSIPDNKTFKAVWNKIISIGIGVKNNNRKLFLLLAQLRSVRGQSRSLAWLADYLDACEFGVDAHPLFPGIMSDEKFFTEAPDLEKATYIDALVEVMGKKYFLILSTE